MPKSGLAMDMPKHGLTQRSSLAVEWRKNDKISKTILNDYECSSIC